jgi:threonine synthase
MLSAKYDYEKLKESFTPSSVAGRIKSLWRYGEVLPVLDNRNVVTLGEGFTPIVRLDDGILLKDDGQIPTGTFKARGMSVAVSKAKELGLTKLAVPSAGNAGAALACYSAAGGVPARIYMPRETPKSMKLECRAFGAELVLVDGNIDAAGARMRQDSDGCFDLSTLKEPYRLEGKKTMGYEIAEQLGLDLPDVIVYPTGGGTGLIGMWKAFDELEELGWIDGGRPRMVSVQTENCAPVVEAFAKGMEQTSRSYSERPTVAVGLRVPRPFAGRQILEVLRRSKGTAVSVTDAQIIESMRSLAKQGIFACPEGAATLAGYEKLLEEGAIDRAQRVLLYNTGTGLKYLSLFAN